MGPCPAVAPGEPGCHRGTRGAGQGKHTILSTAIEKRETAGAVLLTYNRPLSRSTRSAKASPLSRSRSTSSLSRSDSPKPTGSRPRCPDVASTPPPTRRSLRLFRSSFANSLGSWCMTRPPWSVARPPPTWQSLSRRCLPPLSSTK